METDNKRKCTHCKVNLPISDFKIKRSGEYYKQCTKCCEDDKKYRKSIKCEHKRYRYQCKECCTLSFCDHNKKRSTCVECKGSQICEHLRQRSQCRECEGSQICEHDKVKSACKECNLPSCIKNTIRTRMFSVLGYSNLEYLGCTIEEFIAHIEGEFKENMKWENHGMWHFDYIKPLGEKGLTEEDIIERLEFTNIRPLWTNNNNLIDYNKEL